MTADKSDATIMQTQIALSRLGFSPGRLDGLPGPRTRAALDAAGVSALSPADALTVLSASVDAEALYLPSLEEMKRIAPAFPAAWVRPLHAALRHAHIIPARLPQFLAQIGHESAGFATLEEYATGEAYEGRADLGNVQPGDGVRYKGRGVIQLTGRANYARYGSLLKTRLEVRPARAAQPDTAFMIAAVYWLDHNLNAPTDRGDIETVTRRINGGLNGLSDRQRRLDAARAVFTSGGAAPQPPVIEGPAEDDAPTVIKRNPTLTPAPAPTPAPSTTPSPTPSPASSTTPSSTPAPAPASQVRPMSKPTRKDQREDRREDRKDRRALRRQQRAAVRQQFATNAARWVGRYRDILDDELAEGSTEREAHETAIRAALESFVSWSLNLLARLRFASLEDRFRFINDAEKRELFRSIVRAAFSRALRHALQDVQEAREVAALLTDRGSKAADSVGDFLGAFSDVLDGGAPEIIEPPRRDPIVMDRSPGALDLPGTIGGIPVMDAPTRAPVNESDIIEIPGA